VSLCWQQHPKSERAVRLVYPPVFCKLPSSFRSRKKTNLFGFGDWNRFISVTIENWTHVHLNFLCRDYRYCHVPKYRPFVITADLSDFVNYQGSSGVMRGVSAMFWTEGKGGCYLCGGKCSRFCSWTRSQSCLVSGRLVWRSVWPGSRSHPIATHPSFLVIIPTDRSCFLRLQLWHLG
jgi:hypothetical protein